VLTRNPSFYKENINNIVSKIVVIKESKNININEVSKILGAMQIEKLNIFSIDYNSNLDAVNYIVTNNNPKITYVEIQPKNFIEFLNLENHKFVDYNKDSLYLVRGASYLDIKNLFTEINHCQVNLCRGGSQKAHVLSPLDFRLSCYLMAMFNFDFKLINYLNTFYDLNKDRYLS
jgi:hypothetical protein